MLYISSLHYDTSTSIGEEKLHMFDRVAVALTLCLLFVSFVSFVSLVSLVSL